MLNPGDVVKLKSGGPQMTVTWVGKKSYFGAEPAAEPAADAPVVAHCMWFDDKNKQDENEFPIVMLELISVKS